MSGAEVVPIAIVLADDHTMVRMGLRMVLERESDLRVVGEAGDIEEALRRTRDEHPRVAVLDLNMPGGSTLEAIPTFRSECPDAAVVVLTAEAEPAMVLAALRAGAAGYVLKHSALVELVDAIRAVASGRTYLTPSLGARVAQLAAGGELRGDIGITVGSTFASHRIDAAVGYGGMGVVYRATDLALDRTVALKVIAPAVAADPVFRARFERECRAAAAIDHPHVVPVFHAGEERGLLYLTMRFVEGVDLRWLLTKEGALHPLRGVTLIAQVAGGLDAAHQLGIVHRDVKPANVLVGRRAGGEHAFLTDFGVTKRIDPGGALTATGQAVGTADCMAPEQAAGDAVDRRTDVYSLGCVLFHALTGRPPYTRDTVLETGLMLTLLHPDWRAPGPTCRRHSARCSRARWRRIPRSASRTPRPSPARC